MSKNTRPLRRTAALLCAALAGLSLAGRAAAQVTGPLATSPPHPVATNWSDYHSGGGAFSAYPVAPAATAALGLTPLIDPLQGQLQGTSTGLYNGNLTQIPSFLLGPYDPTQPPAGLVGNVVGGINIYYPDHFADGDIFSWSAPFSYVSQTASLVTVDDLGTAPTAGVSGFTATSGFAQINTTLTNPSYPAAGTATGSEYLRLATGVPGSAVWTLYQATAGNYSIYFHIPNDLADSNGLPEVRDTQVTYLISVRDAGGNVTTTTTATASQTEANDSQFLAGPFQVAAGGTVVVTLTRSSTPSVLNNGVDYIVADSMTLEQTIGDVQSAPTAITYDLYPNDFNLARLRYWGIFVPPASAVASGQQTAGTSINANANPDTTGAAYGAAAINSGTILLKTGNPATALDTTGAVDPLRRIRQLVYFGRSDPAASISNSVDDNSSTNFAGNGVFTPVTNTTASNGEYKRYPTNEGLVTAATPVAIWSVPVPSGSSSTFFVYAHIPANQSGETRLASVYYTVTETATTGTVTSAPVAISQVAQGTDALVALPTGGLLPVAGTNIVVRMYNVNNSTAVTPTSGSVVVADSVTVSTGTGQGAIYCVDGFTGGVVWRYETPGSANGASAPVFASPTIAKINVMVTPPVYGTGGTITTPAVYANTLVAIIGDNNGLVYCLDAIGNGDGTSNVNVLAKDTNGNPIPGEPVTITQPPYGAVVTPLSPTTTAASAAPHAHVGTTGAYWIYRPDASRPKYVTGTNRGAVKPSDPTVDLPVPAAFNNASPTIFIDPTVSTAAPIASNSTVYIGNSNGVLYALDGGGVAIDGDNPTDFDKTGDTFNVSQDVQGGVFPTIPSTQPKWWFSLRGVDPNSGDNASSADIESAPAVYVKVATTAGATTYVPTVYIGSAHEQESTSNIGRLYALDGIHGPSGNNGRTSPLTQSDPTAANYTGPGSFNYNVGQVPQTSKTDTSDWSFPDGNNTKNGPLAGFAHTSSTQLPRPALGNMTGSPVVFTNIHETNANLQTRIYVAASSGLEYPATARPDDTLTGRIWAVNLDGSVGTTTNQTTGVWAYPAANDPNDNTQDAVAEPYPPMGSFLRATPAIGFVEFPTNTFNGDGVRYNPADAFNTTGISGQTVPMLYVGTQGVNDTALYAIDIDGAMTTPSATLTQSETAANDQRTIYRVVSPDGSIFQASPALITNATNTAVAAPGNGGAVYAVAGNTLYDYSATPITNPFAGEGYPLIRENRAFTGFGPISSPAIAGANVADITSAAFTTYTVAGTTYNTTDWVYVGDSDTGLCRGITPNDPTYGGIPSGLGLIIPPDVTPPTATVLDAIIQTFLTKTQTDATSATAEPVGVDAPLPVFEWGQSVYARFTNVAPPNPKIDPNLFVYDTRKYTAADLAGASASSPIPFYTSDGTENESVTFNLSNFDVTAAANTARPGIKYVQPVLLSTPPPDGFVADTTSLPSSFPANVQGVVQNLTANNGSRYLGTYTYTIADGSALSDTPGARQRFQNVSQKVNVWNYIGGDRTQIGSYQPTTPTTLNGDTTGNNLVTATLANGKYGFTAASAIPAVDQPIFGILNPLGVRGGGVNLLPSTGPKAVPIGEELGPFRSANSPPTLSTTAGKTITEPGDSFTLEALTNGNSVPTVAPPSSSGGPANPILLPEAATGDPNGVNSGTTTAVVVTTTGLIAHNTSGSNSEVSSGVPAGKFNTQNDDGLPGATTSTPAPFGGYALDVFDRGDLFNLGQTLRVKVGVASTALSAPPTVHNGIYWNSNVGNANNGNPTPGVDTTGHDAVVNFLPWEIAPIPYAIGANGSQDYPDIAPGNLIVSSSGEDLTSANVTLTPGLPNGKPNNDAAVAARQVIANPVAVQISVPNHQPANQQIYQQPTITTQTYQYPQSNGLYYNATGQTAPVTAAGGNNITQTQVFPMGYVTAQRIYVPDARGNYSSQRPYRIVNIYTGVPIDMRTSIVNPTIDIGKAPAAFGVQTEQYTTATNPLGFFMPYNPAFQNYFKPMEIHNDGNVNLLDVHMDQKYTNINTGGVNTLLLNSDSVDPLSYLGGFDLNTVTGPQDPATGNRLSGGSTVLLNGTQVPEQAYLVRSSIDTDLIQAYGRNPAIVNNTLYANTNAIYPGATFHKPTAGGNQPSILTVPDDPETYVDGASLDSAPNGVPTMPTSTTVLKAPPYVSLAFPFGTPVGTYSTPVPNDPTSLRLFEGLDTNSATAYSLAVPPTNAIPYYLYPPKYNGAVGGIGTPSTGTPLPDVYTAGEPLSSIGTQLIGTVLEQRLTDGATFGAVPMIDAPQVPPANGNATTTSTPDFAPAAFRDPSSGDLSAYWTSGRGTGGAYGIYGANLPFTLDPASNTTGQGYFLPTNPAGQWWQPITPNIASSLATGVNSGLSITPGATVHAFDVAVTTAPYSNTLYSYTVDPATGALSGAQAVTTDTSQVKYGVKGLNTGNSFTNNLWAFWTASTGGRTALNYNSLASGGAWQTTSTLLPVPAGLTSVADASPILMSAPVTTASGTALAPTIEVTYSGTAPDGNVDLYVSHYQPDGTTAATATKLDLVPFPTVTENLRAAGQWYQSRDAAWSRTGALNISVFYKDANGVTQSYPALLYSNATPSVPQFTRAIYDKASGLLVLTGVKVPIINITANAPQQYTTNTVYVDAATGRIRFSPALLTATQSFTQIQATFNPLARRLTLTRDGRTNTAPVTFLDDKFKANDAANIANSTQTANVEADRRWTIWRKSGVSGVPSSASLYYKTQRLTFFLPSAVDVTKAITVTLNNTQTTNYDLDYSRGRIYFPITPMAEGGTVAVSYTAPGGTTQTTIAANLLNTVQWQDEPLANNSDVPPADSAAGLDAIYDNGVPLDTAVNENNVSAFLDPFAGVNSSHKVWLFWNSTRNGTADIYSETIDPRFAPGTP
ncbi:MAG: hypothetical protein ACRYFS_01415 [Janthinobacterium lividum]